MEKQKVLIAEDDDVFIPIIRLGLREFNFDIDIVTDGKSALQYISDNKYALVISDYRLPEVHGLDILRAAKKHAPSCHTLLISVATDDMMDIDLEDLNLLGFIQKPLSPIQIRNVLATVF